MATRALVVAALCPWLAAQPYVVVGPRAFAAAAAPLLALRKAQGLAPRYVELEPALAADVEALRARVRQEVERSPDAGYLLLLGDSERGKAPLPSLRRPGLQALLPGMPGKPQVWSDLGYVDLAGSGAPTWALGRIPARSADEVSAVVAKIAAYEKTPPGPWVREIELVAGDGNFGVVIDTVLTGALRQLFAEELPAAFALGALIALPDSPFFASPATFGQKVQERLDRGPFALVYAGHGWIDRFADLRLRGLPGSWPILRNADVGMLASAERTIVLAWACHIGEFPRECLGEVLLRAPHGPVAVVGASEVSFPFGDFVLGRELMRAQDDPKLLRLGDLVRAARARMLVPVLPDSAEARDPFRKRAAMLAGLLGLDPEKQGALLRYTADLYHLLGDPALLLPARGTLELEVLGTPRVGEKLAFRVRVPAGSGLEKLTLEVCKERGVDPVDLLATTELAVAGDAAEAELPWPASASRGPLFVRVLGVTPTRTWLGGRRVRVAR